MFVFFVVFVVVVVVVGLFVDACFQVCIVVTILLVYFSLIVFVFVLFLFFFSFVCLFSFLEGSGVFISMCVGAGSSYNHMLVRKLTFLILKLHINLKCGQEVWL